MPPRTCSGLAPSCFQVREMDLSKIKNFLQKFTYLPLERNSRSSWDGWVRERFELTLEMMELLAISFFHSCKMKSRLGFGFIFGKKWKGISLAHPRVNLVVKIFIFSLRWSCLSLARSSLSFLLFFIFLLFLSLSISCLFLFSPTLRGERERQEWVA